MENAVNTLGKTLDVTDVLENERTAHESVLCGTKKRFTEEQLLAGLDHDPVYCALLASPTAKEWDNVG
jgi:hypothetical protein